MSSCGYVAVTMRRIEKYQYPNVRVFEIMREREGGERGEIEA